MSTKFRLSDFECKTVMFIKLICKSFFNFFIHFFVFPFMYHLRSYISHDFGSLFFIKLNKSMVCPITYFCQYLICWYTICVLSIAPLAPIFLHSRQIHHFSSTPFSWASKIYIFTVFILKETAYISIHLKVRILLVVYKFFNLFLITCNKIDFSH